MAVPEATIQSVRLADVQKAHILGVLESVEYRDVTVDELRAADAAWLVSSVRLAVAVTALDGVEFPHDTELTRALNASLLARTGS